MAQQTLNNGESGATIRGKINDNFTELYGREPYPTVANFAALPTPDGTQGIYLSLASTGIWPLRKPAGLWRDSGSWTWLGNFTWTAEELVFVPAGGIAAANVQAAIEELDARAALTQPQAMARSLGC